MSQINVNQPSDGGESPTSAGINLVTVLLVLLVVVAVLAFLFMGPFQSLTRGGSVDVNVNPPAQQEQPAAPKPKVDLPAAPSKP